MNLKTVLAVALVGAMSASITTRVLAEGADSISQRQNLMKSGGGIMRTAGALSGADAIAAGETLVSNFTALNDLWDKDSMTGDTKALPEIWNANGAKSAGFQMGLDYALAAAQGVLAAAKTGDAEAYGASLKAMGGTCGACHANYRGK